jgi:tetratricopeptide (TPR) repeat protein
MSDQHEWPSELSLDDEAGPASYLSPKARDALLNDVLAQAYPKRRRWAPIAAAALLLCVGGGSASAAVLWYLHSRPAPAPRLAPKPVPVEPTPIERAPMIEAAKEEEAPAPAMVRRAAEDWLREGNRQRGAKHWKQADEAYGKAAQHAASSDSAYVAFVASAAVRLEHLHDARGALARYRAALRAAPRGSLDEEIRLGIADAYRALGEREREREALQVFLRDHADSPLAEQARARLQ